MTHHSGQINKAQILDGSFASSTSANESTNQATDTSSSHSSDSETSTSSKTGSNTGTNNEEESYSRVKSGNYGKDVQDLILKYRQTIVAVDKEIIEELRSLFMAFLF